jgi:hypothetical protein
VGHQDAWLSGSHIAPQLVGIRIVRGKRHGTEDRLAQRTRPAKRPQAEPGAVDQQEGLDVGPLQQFQAAPRRGAAQEFGRGLCPAGNGVEDGADRELRTQP